MSKYIKTETPLLDVDREISWKTSRRYQRMFQGRLSFDLTNEDDIAYIKNKHNDIIAWVRMIIPKSYA